MGLLQRLGIRKGVADRYFDLKSPPVSLLYGGEKNALRNEYRQLPIVYAVINAIASRVASVTPRFYRTGTDTEVTHPVIDRLMAPRMGWTWSHWLQAWVISKNLHGEFLATKSESLVNGVPVSLDNIGYTRYQPEYDRDGQFVGWNVDSKKVYEPSEVIFDRFVNPWDDIRGMSKLEAARVSNETEWSARRFNKRFFDNDATPGGYFKAPEGLTEPQRQRMRHDMIEARKGAENAHSWVLLEGETSIEQIGLSQRDAQFIEQFNLTLHDICAVFGVDPAIIGFEKESKYASAKEARKYMWTDTVLPTLTDIARVLNSQLLEPYGITLDFDTDGIEALQTNFNETVEAAEKLYNMGVPFNMINERLELGFDPVPGGDDPKPQGSPMMLDHEPEAKKEVVIGPKVEEGPVKREEINRSVDAVVLKAINDPVDKLVSGLDRKLKRFFFDVKKQLEREAKSWTFEQTKEIDGETIDNAITFDRLASIILEFLTESGVIGWNQITNENVSITNPPEAVLNMVANRAGMIKEVAENAKEEVRKKVQDAVREAIEDGLTERETTQRILDGLDGAIENLQSRAKTIARTEVHAAHSEARFHAMEDSEPVAKRWVAAGDARGTHIANAERGIVDWNETYNGGLRYPLDSGPASEVVNCRCALVPYYEGEV